MLALLVLALFSALAATQQKLGCCALNGGAVCISGAPHAQCPGANPLFYAENANCCRLKQLACTQAFLIVDGEAIESTCATDDDTKN